MIFCIAMFLYAFSVSDSRPPGSIYKYYFISLTASVCLMIVFYRCKDEKKVNIALLLFFTGISVYIIEILIVLHSHILTRVLIPAKVNTKTIKSVINNGSPVDPRGKYEITMDLRKKGIDAYPHFFPARKIGADGINYKGFSIYPLGAVSKKITVFCNEGSGPVIYETDEYGFRNPQGQYYRGSFDVALIGDSFAQGHCVKNGEDIAGHLRKDSKRVLNLGIEASGPLIELGILSEYAKPFKPKNVFWLYYEGNDLPNLSGEKMSPALMKYLDKSFSQDLVHNQYLVDTALIADIEKEIAGKIAHDTGEKGGAAKKTYPSIPAFKETVRQIITLDNLRLKLGLHRNCLFDIDPLFRYILTEANRRVETWGGQLYFVYLPSYDRYKYKKDLCVRRRFKLHNKRIIPLVKELNIKIIDMTEYFDSQGDPLSLFHGHYNAKGYGLVAQKIQEHLE
jgi:hypothetical protein